MLVATDVMKSFGKKTVIHPISFTLDRGITGLLGPNGAGKTTLLRILATYHLPTKGRLSLNNISWDSEHMEHIRSFIGYLPQHVGLFPTLTCTQYLEYMGILRGMQVNAVKPRIAEVLHEVHLEERARDTIRSLSGGMKQRLGIAQAIIHNPALLLVDEPTAGLDPEERIRFRNLIKRLGQDRTVLLSTHITDDVTMTCDKVYLMQNGHMETHEDVHSVVAYANKRVWKFEANASEYERLKLSADIFITNLTETESREYIVRAISDEPPVSYATPVHPTLEEGYMVWLHKS